MGFYVGNQGISLSLTSGASGRRYPNHRKHGLCCFAVTMIVAHAATICEKKVDPLRTVERTAATEGDDRINLKWSRKGTTCFHQCRVGVDIEVVEFNYFDTRCTQRRYCFCNVTGSDQTEIGYEQRSLEIQFFAEFTEPSDYTRTEDGPSPGLKVES